MLGYTLVGLVSELLQLYTYVIIAAALITWVSPDPRNPIVRFLYRVTEPVLRPVRELLPPWKTGGLDISPMIVLVALQVVRWWILPLLY